MITANAEPNRAVGEARNGDADAQSSSGSTKSGNYRGDKSEYLQQTDLSTTPLRGEKRALNDGAGHSGVHLSSSPQGSLEKKLRSESEMAAAVNNASMDEAAEQIPDSVGENKVDQEIEVVKEISKPATVNLEVSMPSKITKYL